MIHPLLAFGIGLGEIIILALGAGLLLLTIICVIALITRSKKSQPPVLPPSQPVEQRLIHLKDLLAKNLITEAEFQERRAAILKDL